MKFYDCSTAPSPRRVRIFLAEKGITLPTVQVDLRNGEQFSPAFRAINPDCTVPALALDDGTVIADAVAICGYLEELHPEPPLIGATAQERAVVTALNRQIERDGFFAAMDAFRNAARGRTTMSRSPSSPRAAVCGSSISSVRWMHASPRANSWPGPASPSRIFPRWC